MNPAAPVSYDDLAYPGHPYAQTHPDRLATLGRLFGMNPAPVERCRVLELACGDGANLIPMAYSLAGSHFLGIDFASQPIARGCAQTAALGLSNIELRALDILGFSPDAADPFDYIIAHGVYSWAPPAVRERILAICGAHLAPQGIAYISYKAYPGGHLSDMEREMVRYHASRMPDATPAEKVHQAIALLKFLAESKPEANAYRSLLSKMLEISVARLRQSGPGAYYHDAFSEFSEPVYFYRFIEQAAQHGLQFLSEARLSFPQPDDYTPAALEALQALSADFIAQEQYLDFLACRPFRQTLLCRCDVALDRSLNASRAYDLCMAGDLRPCDEPALLNPQAAEKFVSARGGEVSTNHPLVKAAFRHLGQRWPAAVAFPDLLAVARRAMVSAADGAMVQRESDLEGGEEGKQELAEALLAAYASDLVELLPRIPTLAADLSERPEASRLARLQIAAGESVTTLRHQEARIEDAMGRRLLTLLDGSRDHAAILEELGRAVASGQVSVSGPEGQLEGGLPQALARVEAGLEANLKTLARLALLIG
jgi:hypothetical protein